MSVLKKLVGATLVLAIVLFQAGPTMANPLVPMPEPHPGFVVHLNTGVQMLGPWNPLYVQPFTDALFSLPNPWHWETETHNFSGTTRTFIEGWYAPGFSYVAQVTLPPGTSIYTHFMINDVPEVGNWLAYMWNGLPYPLDMHMTVQEGTYEEPDDPFEIRGAYSEMPHGTPADISHGTPEPATMILLALGGLAALVRRKRH